MQPHLWQFLALTFAGWVNRSQQDVIEYLKEENRVLREQLGARRLRFTGDHGVNANLIPWTELRKMAC